MESTIDHVEPVGALGGEARAVGDHHARLRVVEGAVAQRWQPAAAQLDHAGVDLDLRYALDQLRA